MTSRRVALRRARGRASDDPCIGHCSRPPRLEAIETLEVRWIDADARTTRP
jgi:hypothetical protein